MEGPLLGLFLLVILAGVCQAAMGGLFISNGTNILFANEANENQRPTAVYGQENARIVGMDTDIRNGYIFWSDVGFTTRGLYRAKISDDGTLSEVTKLIYQDLGEVNGLSVDYINKHVYWTDSKKRSIEVCDYDGNNRRALITTKLFMPRGIIADPVNKFLFWNDQGSTKKIERSYLDGSGRSTIVDSKLEWPNQMVVDHNANRLIWVDAKPQKVMSSKLDGGDTKTVFDLASRAGNDVVFGVALHGNLLYVSAWNSGKVFRFTKAGNDVKDLYSGLGDGAMFSLAYASEDDEPTGSSPCISNNGGCSHLCLPTASSKRCSCPSYGGLSLRGNDCKKPTNLLFYCLADQGEVGFIDMDAPSSSTDRYTVGKSLRPVAVTYDPVEEKVYWSDVHERVIHVANLDGTDHHLFLTSNNTIGIVDGLALDVNNRKLYFTNMGMVAVDGASFAWHKVEAIGVDGEGRRTILDQATKPRGLYADQSAGGHLYVTDWGSQAAVTRVNKDGSDPQLILFPGLDNPNGVYHDSNRQKIYVVDSHYKTNKDENGGSFGPPKDASLYRMNENGQNVQASSVQLKTPFGITAYNNYIYVSDWERRSILKLNSDGEEQSVLMSDIDTPMGLYYSPRSQTASSTTCSGTNQCEELCFDTGTGVCACDSYDAKVLQNDDTCQVPSRYMLLADFNSLKFRSLESGDNAVYNAFGGSSYFSNFVSVAHDSQNSVVYFSDVNRRSIFRTDLESGDTNLFLKTENDIIDGMVLADGKIYWTDFFEGEIAFADISSDPVTRVLLVGGLKKPRALFVKDNHIYWTEWGDKPRVGRANLPDGDGTTTLVSDGLTRPNGLDIRDGKMYIGDAPRQGDAKVLECDLSGSNCMEIKYMTGVPKHIYSIRKYGQQMYYSDWVAGEVAMVDMTTGRKVSIARNLMRPTEIVIEWDAQALACPSGHGCGDECHAYHGGYYCGCREGRKLTSDDKTCEDSDDLYIPTNKRLCESACSEKMVCAQMIGTTTFECVCKAGYGGSSCTGCGNNMFKAYPGPGDCKSCPSSSSSTSASTQCECSSNLLWNRASEECTGNKPGQCPVVSQVDELTCDDMDCSGDGDCKGAQKCCGSSHCGSGQNRCRDPVSLWECVYKGQIYRVGQSFMPDSCTKCNCLPNKFYNNPLYGGAKCEIMDCPKQDCDVADQVTDNGKCCPYCTDGSNKVIEIKNCPEEPLEEDLPDDKPFIKFNRRWQVRDKLNRDYDLIQDPRDEYFVYQEGDIAQQVKLTARAGSDEDVCDFSIVVKDNTVPTVTCPGDLGIYVSEAPVKVKWAPPKYSDNVCTHNTMKKCAVEETSGKHGTALAAGKHTIQYSVTDQAGLKGECMFEINIEVETQCPPPAFFNGMLECSSSGSKRSCDLKCDEGYTPYLASFKSFSCDNDVWTPEINKRLRTIQCRKSTAVTINGAMYIKGIKCPRQTSMASVILSLQENLTNKIGNNSPIQATVKGRGCGKGIRSKRAADTLEIDIDMVAVYETDEQREEVEQEMNNWLQKIEEELKNGKLMLYDEDGGGLGEGAVSASQAQSGCLPGSEKSEDGKLCFTCPVGTYETGGKCEDCATNSYQDLEGQTQCESCPADTHTEEKGSIFQNECVDGPDDPDGMDPTTLIIIIVVVVVVVLIIIIIVIVVCIVKKRKARNQSPGNDDKSFNNKAFDSEQTEYAEINEKNMASGLGGDYTHAGAVKSQDPNDYASLQK